MLVYMIRHGESTANATRSHAGWAQIPLTAQGRAEALLAADRLRGIAFDKVYSSDLARAIETKEIALPGVSFVQSPLLREIGVGTLSGKRLAECEQAYGEDYVRDRAAKDFTAFGGENVAAHRARVAAFLEEIASQNDTRVAVFCHEGTIQRCLEIATDSTEVTRRHCKNGGVCVFEYASGKWTLVGWEI